MISIRNFLKELEKKGREKSGNRNLHSYVTSRGASLLKEEKLIYGSGVVSNLSYALDEIPRPDYYDIESNEKISDLNEKFPHIRPKSGNYNISGVHEIPDSLEKVILFIIFRYNANQQEYTLMVRKKVKTQTLKNKYVYLSKGNKVAFSATTPRFMFISSNDSHFVAYPKSIFDKEKAKTQFVFCVDGLSFAKNNNLIFRFNNRLIKSKLKK